MALTKATEKVISDNLKISGIATATNFKTGSTNVHSTGVEAAGVNVLGADTPIGSGSTIYDDGGARFSGVVTATSFQGDGGSLTGIDASSLKSGSDIKAQANPHGVVITGVATATSFVGDGSGLIGVASTDNIQTSTAATFTSKVDITEGVLELPVGNTAARSSIPSIGDFRYNNQTSQVEFYDGGQWKNIMVDAISQPLINNISPTSFSGAAGTSITIIGQNFVSGANVHFVSSVNGSSTAAGSVAFASAGILTAVTPTLTTAGEPYGVKVTNPDGGQGLLEAALDAGSSPTFTTPAGSLGSGIQKGSTISGIAVTATDPDGQTVTYSEVTSVLTSNSNTPASTMNLTLNSSTGVISGTAPNVSSDTTYNFTIRASDGVNTTDRNFSLGIQAASNPLYWFRGSAHGGTGASDTSVHGGFYTHGNNSSSSGGGNANNDRTYVYKNGNSGVGVGIHQYLTTNNSATIPADHNKFRVVVSSNSVYSHHYGFGWGTGSSGTSANYTFAKYNTGNGTFTYDIPGSMVGNAYHFTSGVYCGQNCNNQIQITLAVSFNSANPP